MISIALATYNGEKYILQQIDSILKQTYKDFELVINDDCSTDNTFQLITELAKKDKRIKCYKNESNLGFKKNFEKLINYCSGEYIAFSDQDDIWSEDHIDTLLNIIGDNYISCANAELIDMNGCSLNYTMKNVLVVDYIPYEIEKQFKFLLFSNFVQGSAMFIRTDFAKKHLPIPEFFKFHDYYFAFISTLNGVPIKYTEKILLKYRQHGNNVTENEDNSSIKILFKKPNKKKFNIIKESIEKCISICDFALYLNKNVQFEISINEARQYFQNFLAQKYISNAFFRIKHFDDIYLIKDKKKKFILCIRAIIGGIYHQIFSK